jgi:midasin (ATPase involved in ribosome maturation)
LKRPNPLFDEKCSRLLDETKHAKMQRLQDPHQSHVDNLYNVRREASRHFRNKKKEYLEAEIDKLETNINPLPVQLNLLLPGLEGCVSSRGI